MTRLAKLYARVLNDPGASITFREFERLLSALGFTHQRTVGSHRLFTHSRVPRPFPVQAAGKDAKPYQVRQLLAIVEQYELGLTE
jgi:predicted RNA binding protein YcfA (HicA-like mRNA interferase family)